MLTRYTASKDNTITNAFDSTLRNRGELANMGESDSLEVFYIANQAYQSSSEKSRILMKFDLDRLEYDRSRGYLPSSGGVDFYLRLFNIQHVATLPRKFKLSVHPLLYDWEEGDGLDMEEYVDLYSSNWLYRDDNNLWISEGGDFSNDYNYYDYFDKGDENLCINITDLVENWVGGQLDNHGVCVKLSGNFETGSNSYYTKKFSARGTEYFFNRPVLEARWNSAHLDGRYNFFVSSAFADSSRNTNTIYFFNKIRGSLYDAPMFTSSISVVLDASMTGSDILGTFDGGRLDTGIYTASCALYTTASVIYDKWFADGICYYTGTINIREEQDVEKYYCTITNLKPEYSNDELVTLYVFTRAKNWSPTIYTKAIQTVEQDYIENLHYSVMRVTDKLIVVDYDTVNNSTKLSYGENGSYFTLDTSLLEEDYQYEIRFKIMPREEELSEKFRFRVGRTYK
jgi:hypothetical protein